MQYNSDFVHCGSNDQYRNAVEYERREAWAPDDATSGATASLRKGAVPRDHGPIKAGSPRVVDFGEVERLNQFEGSLSNARKEAWGCTERDGQRDVGTEGRDEEVPGGSRGDSEYQATFQHDTDVEHLGARAVAPPPNKNTLTRQLRHDQAERLNRLEEMQPLTAKGGVVHPHKVERAPVPIHERPQWNQHVPDKNGTGSLPTEVLGAWRAHVAPKPREPWSIGNRGYTLVAHPPAASGGAWPPLSQDLPRPGHVTIKAVSTLNVGNPVKRVLKRADDPPLKIPSAVYEEGDWPDRRAGGGATTNLKIALKTKKKKVKKKALVRKGTVNASLKF